jgi:hydrogenase nickel incorporation protein HypB
MTDKELESLAEEMKRASEDLSAMTREEERGGKADLLAASRLLERSLFHVERALSSPGVTVPVEAERGEMLDIEIEEDLLEANRLIAQENRAIFASNGVRTIDVMGAVGSGKTSLIAAMVERLQGRSRVGMLGGDVATSIDANRVREKGARTLQINTGKECHLDANLVRRALEKIGLDDIDVMFIENVGNLICPSEFDLGCEKRVVVISVTEGDDMVVKHPLMFIDAGVVAINKIDMARVFGADVGKLEQDLASMNPAARAIRTSARTGEGVGDLLESLGLLSQGEQALPSPR